jgi:Uncharacterized protein conserved in bacteria
MMARKQFLLRIDPELWKQLEKWAADDLRSVNAQVEWLLREAVRKRKGGHRRSDSAAGDEVDEDAGDEVGDVQPDATDPLVRRRS